MATFVLEEDKPKLQGGQDGIKYKMYSAGPALKIGPEVKVDGVRVNCGKFNEGDGYEGSHLEMVPLPKQVLNMVMRKWRAESYDDFNTYMNNPTEESALFNDSESLKKVWSEVAQIAFGPKSSRFWIGGPDQCKMAGRGMYGWRVARLRNLPRPHKLQEEKEEEEEEEEEGGGNAELQQQLAQKNAEIENLRNTIIVLQNTVNDLEPQLDYTTSQYNNAAPLADIMKFLEAKSTSKSNTHFITDVDAEGDFFRLPRWDRLQDIVYNDENGKETFTFTFAAPAAAGPGGAAAGPGGAAPAPGGAAAAGPGGAAGVAAAPAPGGDAALKQYREAFDGGYGMKVENQTVEHVVPNKDTVLEKLKLNDEKYQELLKKSAKGDLEFMLQKGALVQDTIILPWSIVKKIVKGMKANTFYTVCSKSDETNRVIQQEGTDVLLNNSDGWDIYGVVSLTNDVIKNIVNNALDNTFVQNVPATNVLAFISCRSAKEMEQTLQLNQGLPNLEPWISSGPVIEEKNKIYEVDTVCSRSSKKRLGQLLMLWALSKQLDSSYYGTALKVVKLASTVKQGVTYHGPPDIEVANLYHNLFKYQRAFPFPLAGGTEADKRWHKIWTEEIPIDVRPKYWDNVKRYFDPTQPAPYITEKYTYGEQDPAVIQDANSTYNREEYWMYRPYPTGEQLETIATYVLDRIIAPAPAAAAGPGRRASSRAK